MQLLHTMKVASPRVVQCLYLFLLCASWMESTSAEDEPRATTGCDALTDLASIAVMKSNGWKFDFTDPDAKRNFVGQQCIANGQKAKWFGWSRANAVGTLSATFTGSGEATVDFGNCWNAGNVKLYLDSTLIETAPVGTKSKLAKVVFTPGAVLKLKDEDGNAVVMLNSVSINCDSPISCQQYKTPSYNVAYLKDIAQFNIKCPISTALKSFQLSSAEDPKNKLYRYNFECCTNPGQQMEATQHEVDSYFTINDQTSNALANQNVNCVQSFIANSNLFVMYEFQMILWGDDVLAYNIGCVTGNNPIKCINRKTLANGNQIDSLIQQNPNCPTDFENMYPYVQSFQLVSNGSSVYYNYTCCNFI